MMIDFSNTNAGQFCWVDLAATDATRAASFYRNLFGWLPYEQLANGGRFTRLRLSDRDVGSLYQLRDSQRDRGAASHWTPYIRVDDVGIAAQRAAEFGGQVLVPPFAVSNIARIALITDSVGAHVGLWEAITEASHG
jgi:predicted enzyme related to lactoylglutathione lyase